jgi:antitoxin PrlF
LQKQATITSKGQITIPREVRQMLGVRSGDKLIFENDGGGIRVRPLRSQSTFSKYRGIGNPSIAPGRKGIARWLRELRGEEPATRE